MGRPRNPRSATLRRVGMSERDLDELLRLAEAADGLHRMDYRDPIAAFGARAVRRLESWLLDPRLSAFAVRTTVAAARNGAMDEARAALGRARGKADTAIRRDIDEALSRLAGRPGGRTCDGGAPSLDRALEELRGVTAEWRQRGSPPQGSTEWRKADWVRCFPAHATFLRRQPGLLDRAAVARAAARATDDRDAAEAAFLLSKAWGEGKNGYGCTRALESFDLTADIGGRLLDVARTLHAEGAAAAYARMCDGGDCRIVNLGPAFGTKFLYFVQPPSFRQRALIHDRVVAKWLREHAGLALGTDKWSMARYARYLDQMHEWAEVLDCEPDEVELNIFRSSLPPSSRWAGI